MKKETATKMERITHFKPAYHKVHEDPKKNFGVHNVEGLMVLKGELGAVHFSFGTGIYLPETLAWWEARHLDASSAIRPFGYDVGYHSPTPRYEGQQLRHPTKMVIKNPDLKNPGINATKEECESYFNNVEFMKQGEEPPVCEWIGVPCYCDGSALRAEIYFDALMRQGSDEVWKMLEQEYKSVFNELK